MLQKMGLRTRLMSSYVLLLVISLGIIGVALLVFISTRPVPPDNTYTQLATLVRGLNINNLIQEFRPPMGQNNTRVTLSNLIESFATTRDVRVLQIRISNDIQQVLFDSADVFENNQKIQLHGTDYIDPTLERMLDNQVTQIYGSFIDPEQGEEWLYGGLTVRRTLSDVYVVVLAEPRPAPSLSQVLSEFSNASLVPLVQAALAGMIVSALLAYFISRSIAHPLQAVAEAAPNVVEGHFEQQVPVSGPPEVRAVAEAFNRMSAEVHATQKSQRDFLANVSHDLKTPLTSIQGYSQAIIDGTAKDPANAATIIYDEADRLNRMVIELTDLARIQAGRLSMKTSPIDMGAIAAAIGQRLSVVAQRKGVKLHVEADTMPQIAGDGDRLAQVLTNLVSNAIKFTPPNGHVLLKTQVNRGGVEVIIQDTGIGIPPEDLPRVFERFYQVDKARGPARGTGLGLAIVQEIVQAHGGEIRVFSKGHNKGTSFTVWLPSPNLSTIASSRTR